MGLITVYLAILRGVMCFCVLTKLRVDCKGLLRMGMPRNQAGNISTVLTGNNSLGFHRELKLTVMPKELQHCDGQFKLIGS